MLWVSCTLGWVLLALTLIDWRDGILPDVFTLPLIPAGVVIAYLQDPSRVLACVAGALAGFATFETIRRFYRVLRGNEGLGLGDVKLMAAAGALVSYRGLPSVMLVSAITGLIAILIIAITKGRVAFEARQPFGPALCCGIWLVWLYGPVGLIGPYV